jgi:predicted transcriptional regulator
MSVSLASIRKTGREIEEMEKKLRGLNSITGVIQYSKGETDKAINTVYDISIRHKRKN